MTDVTAIQVKEDMRRLVIEAGAGESTARRRLERAARRLRVPLARVTAIFYGKVRRIDAHEYLTASRRIQTVRLRQLEALREQVEAAEIQYQQDRDALERRLRELAGSYRTLGKSLVGAGLAACTSPLGTKKGPVNGADLE